MIPKCEQDWQSYPRCDFCGHSTKKLKVHKLRFMSPVKNQPVIVSACESCFVEAAETTLIKKHQSLLEVTEGHKCRRCHKDLPDKPAGWLPFQDGWAYGQLGLDKYCKTCLKNGAGDLGI
jgi:hypothetical protein